MSKEEVPNFSWIETTKRSLKRGIKIGAATFVITALAYFTQALPSQYAFLIPVLTALVAFAEKFERNARENR